MGHIQKGDPQKANGLSPEAGRVTFDGPMSHPTIFSALFAAFLVGCAQTTPPSTSPRTLTVEGIAYTIPPGVSTEVSKVKGKSVLRVRHPGLEGGYINIARSAWRPGSGPIRDALPRVFDKYATIVSTKKAGAKVRYAPKAFMAGELYCYGGSWDLPNGNRHDVAYTHVGQDLYQIVGSVPPAGNDPSKKEAQKALLSVLGTMQSAIKTPKPIQN